MLQVYCGCMFSGKSSAARLEALRAAAVNIPVLTVTHSLDTRYGEGIRTHEGKTADNIPFISCSKLKDVLDTKLWKECKMCVIDEGQFFPDLYEICKLMVDQECDPTSDRVPCMNNSRRTIIVAGLDMDSDGNPFGDVVRLGLEADSFIKLQSLCSLCCDGTKSNFSQKYIADSSSQIAVGGSEMYRPVCERHFKSTQIEPIEMKYKQRTITLIIGGSKSGKSTLIKKMEREGRISNITQIFYDNMELTDKNVDNIIDETRSVVVSVHTSIFKEPTKPLIRLASRATKIVHLHALCNVCGNVARGDKLVLIGEDRTLDSNDMLRSSTPLSQLKAYPKCRLHLNSPHFDFD